MAAMMNVDISPNLLQSSLAAPCKAFLPAIVEWEIGGPYFDNSGGMPVVIA
jgi:hypothetical protein